MTATNSGEQIPVTMSRKQWGVVLDYFSAKLQGGDASPQEADIAAHLACALIRAGAARAESAIVTHKLGLMTYADIDLIENLREDACELLGERGWWADESRLDYSRRYHELKERIIKTDELLDKLKGPQTP